MLSRRRVALTFSLCSTPPRTRRCLTTAWKKCKTDKCTLGGQREKANRPSPAPAHGEKRVEKRVRWEARSVCQRGPGAVFLMPGWIPVAGGNSWVLKFQNHLYHQGEVEQSRCPFGSGEPTIPQHWSWERPCTVVSKAQPRKVSGRRLKISKISPSPKPIF